MRRITFLQLVIVALVLGASGCAPGLLQSGPAAGDGAAVQLSFSVGRSVMPDYLDSIAELELKLIPTDDKGIVRSERFDSVHAVVLRGIDPGIYDLEIRGYNSLGQQIVSGSAAGVELEAGRVGETVIELSYEDPGTGSGALDIAWTLQPPVRPQSPHRLEYEFIQVPEAVSSSSDPMQEFGIILNASSGLGETQLYEKWESGILRWQPGEDPASPEGAGISLQADSLPAGTYTILVRLYSSPAWINDLGMEGPYSQPLPMLRFVESVRIDGGVSTAAEIAIDRDQFSQSPVSFSPHVGFDNADFNTELAAYELNFPEEYSSPIYRVERKAGDTWEFYAFEPPYNYNEVQTLLNSETRFRVRAENFTAIGVWKEFSVDGILPLSGPVPDNPLQLLFWGSTNLIPETWTETIIDPAASSGQWFGVTSGSERTQTEPADLVVTETTVGQVNDIDADGHGRAWLLINDGTGGVLERWDSPLANGTSQIELNNFDGDFSIAPQTLSVDAFGDTLALVGQNTEEKTYARIYTADDNPQFTTDVIIRDLVEPELLARLDLSSATYPPETIGLYQSDLHVAGIATDNSEIEYLYYARISLDDPAVPVVEELVLDELAGIYNIVSDFSMIDGDPWVVVDDGTEHLVRIDTFSGTAPKLSSYHSGYDDTFELTFAAGAALPGTRIVIGEGLNTDSQQNEVHFFRIDYTGQLELVWSEAGVQ